MYKWIISLTSDYKDENSRTKSTFNHHRADKLKELVTEVICYFDSGEVEPVEKIRTNDLSWTISSGKIDGAIFLVDEKIEARLDNKENALILQSAFNRMF